MYTTSNDPEIKAQHERMIRINSTYNRLVAENEAVKQALNDMLTRAEESFRLGTAQGIDESTHAWESSPRPRAS